MNEVLVIYLTSVSVLRQEIHRRIAPFLCLDGRTLLKGGDLDLVHFRHYIERIKMILF